MTFAERPVFTIPAPYARPEPQRVPGVRVIESYDDFKAVCIAHWQAPQTQVQELFFPASLMEPPIGPIPSVVENYCTRRLLSLEATEGGSRVILGERDCAAWWLYPEHVHARTD